MVSASRLQQLLVKLQARAQPTLPTDLVPLRIAGVQVGQAQPAIARFIADNVSGFALIGSILAIVDESLDVKARTSLLAETALKLRDAGMMSGWRNELMPVGDPAIATIERAACRPLGIVTQAVHLNAYADAQTLIVARRSAHKQIDPGLWDNLVGGMVAAGQTLDQALQREAWEEAGVQLDRASLVRGRSFHVRRAVPEGLQSEAIHVYDMRVPADATLANQDGEVGAIERRALDEVIEAIEREEFTLESALVILESMTRGKEGTASGFFHWPAH